LNQNLSNSDHFFKGFSSVFSTKFPTKIQQMLCLERKHSQLPFTGIPPTSPSQTSSTTSNSVLDIMSNLQIATQNLISENKSISLALVKALEHGSLYSLSTPAAMESWRRLGSEIKISNSTNSTNSCENASLVAMCSSSEFGHFFQEKLDTETATLPAQKRLCPEVRNLLISHILNQYNHRPLY
jgi:hypothetical protein